MQAFHHQLNTLELLINQALRLDPATSGQLHNLAGKSIRIECSEPSFQVVILLGNDNIELQPFTGQKVTSHLTGNLAAFSDLLTATDKVATLINGNLRLQGDSQLLMELQKILQNLDLDWEFQLARLIGDLPAHWLGKLGRDSFHWLKSTQPVFMRHLQEFILEEAQLSPTKQEMEQFIHGVQDTLQQTERLEAKIARLKQAVTTPEKLP